MLTTPMIDAWRRITSALLKVVKLSPAVTAPTTTSSSSARTSPRLRPTEPDMIFCRPVFSLLRSEGVFTEVGGPPRSGVVSGSLMRRFLS